MITIRRLKEIKRYIYIISKRNIRLKIILIDLLITPI